MTTPATQATNIRAPLTVDPAPSLAGPGDIDPWQGGVVALDGQAWQRVLGDELRRARLQRGWTRRQLYVWMDAAVSVPTLAAYELGKRSCSTVRLAQLCDTLGCSPEVLLANVWARMVGPVAAGTFAVDLTRLVADPALPSALAPLRRWAQLRLAQSGSRAQLFLDWRPLERLALLCRLDAVELYRALRPYTSRPAVGRVDEPDAGVGHHVARHDHEFS